MVEFSPPPAPETDKKQAEDAPPPPPPPPPKEPEPVAKKEEPEPKPKKEEPKPKPKPKKEEPKPKPVAKKEEPKPKPKPKKEEPKPKPKPKPTPPAPVEPPKPAPEVVAKAQPEPGIQQKALPTVLSGWARSVQRKVERFWFVPPGMRMVDDNSVHVSFWVNRHGQLLSKPEIIKKGIQPELGESGIKAILNAQPFPPLPQSFQGNEQQVIYVFSVKN